MRASGGLLTRPFDYAETKEEDLENHDPYDKDRSTERKMESPQRTKSPNIRKSSKVRVGHDGSAT